MLKSAMRSLFCTGWLLILLFFCPDAFSQPPAAKQSEPAEPAQFTDDTHLFMRAKLACAQKLLEGLITENHKSVGEGAKKMKAISEASHWPTSIDEVYQHYSVHFRMQCDKLAEEAEQQNLQAAHYTYLNMSTTCIECHNYVRKRFRVEQEQPNGPVRLIPTQWDGPVKTKSAPPLPVPQQPDPPQPDETTEGNARETTLR